MHLEDEKIKEIHEAMQDSGGSIAAAAVLLSWPRSKLQKAIDCNAELKQRWMVKEGRNQPLPADSDAASRENSIPSGGDVVLVPTAPGTGVDEQETMSDQEYALAMEMRRENEKFSQTLQAIGWDDATVGIATQLQSIAQAHFKSGLELMHGGLQHTFLSNIRETNQIQPLFDQAAEALADEEKYPIGSKQRASIIRELERLHEILSHIKESTVKVNEVIHKSALVQAIMKQNSKKGKNVKKMKAV